MAARLSRTVGASVERGVAPTTAIDRGANRGRRSIGGGIARSPRWRTSSSARAPDAAPRPPFDAAGAAGPSVEVMPSADDGRDAALLERPRDDQPLDLGRPLPDPVDAQLAQEPLGRVVAHVAATAEHLHRAVRTPPGR